MGSSRGPVCRLSQPYDAAKCQPLRDHGGSQRLTVNVHGRACFPGFKGRPAGRRSVAPALRFERKTVGTIWVVAHDERRKFDAEDERIVTTLARFASAAWQLWSAHIASEAAKVELEDKIVELETLHDIVVGRELKMMELEKNVERLQTENIRLMTHAT